MADKTDRRCFLARGVLGAAGLGAAHMSIEENILAAAVQEGATQPSSTPKPKTDIPPGSLTSGKIGKVSMSRLLIGGNLIGGWAHSRDLMYASPLFKAYNTDAKVFETLELAQACGVDTIQLDPACWDVVTKYNRGRSTKIQTMVCVSPVEDKVKMNETIKRNVDLGAALVYSHGGSTDSHMMNNGKIEVLGQMVDLIKAQGVPAGVGGHSLNMPMACEKNKLNVDFYVKTFHMERYWSATPKDRRKEYDWMQDEIPPTTTTNYDNMWCNNPGGDGGVHGHGRQAVGRLQGDGRRGDPAADGLLAMHIRNGADFVIAGMFDFQVETDVKIAIESVKKAADRKRPWRA